MKMPIFSEEESQRIASHFFNYEYQDPGIKKWGGFLLSEHTAKLVKGALDQPKLVKEATRPVIDPRETWGPSEY